MIAQMDLGNKIKRGIDVGHIFKLGVNYSDSMNATISNKNNENVKMIMAVTE